MFTGTTIAEGVSLEGSMSHRWDVELDGSSHVVELGEWTTFWGAPIVFRVDGAEHKVGRAIQIGARTARFDLAGHEASLTKRQVAAGVRTTSSRMFKGGWRRLPAIIAAYALGGSGLGGGAAGAAGAAAMLAWVIYELRVDGASQGSWVVRVEGGTNTSWSFVEPGGPLPERHRT